MQGPAAVGAEVIYYENNTKVVGKITQFTSNGGFNRGKHLIKFPDFSLTVSLKSMVKSKQLILVDSQYQLENIMYPQNYLYLWLSTKSPRHRFWKPTQWNDPTKTPNNCEDLLEFQATARSTRIDSMLKQRHSYSEIEKDGKLRFLKLMVGAAYELQNETKIVVTDITLSRDSQMIHYFHVLEFSICCIG